MNLTDLLARVSALVPASMELPGSRNWYLPSWLEWLPDVRVEPVEE